MLVIGKSVNDVDGLIAMTLLIMKVDPPERERGALIGFMGLDDKTQFYI